MKTYDIAILGAGPGGYVAALYAARLGKKVCLIEQADLGGTCLNHGCIPTKIFSKAARTLSEIGKSKQFGIDVKDVRFDIRVLVKRKNDTVDKLRRGISHLLRSRGVETLSGKGELLDRDSLAVFSTQGWPKKKELVKAKSIIIATGSSEAVIPNLAPDKKKVLAAKDALDLDSVPKDVLIVGGGSIGCEMASAFNAFGAHVTIIEAEGSLLPRGDDDVSKCLETAFKKKGIEVETGQSIEEVVSLDSAKACLRSSSGRSFSADKVLLCSGRKPNVSSIDIEELGLKSSEKGIKVDNNLKTDVGNIYAIGDCIGEPMLAHAAMYEGVIAARNICGHIVSVDYSAVPDCVFSDPDIALAGVTENQASAKGMNVAVSRFHLRSLGKAHALGKTDGFVKLIADVKTNRIIGAALIGEGATELIAEITLAIKKGLTAEDVAGTMHAHPTMSEAVMEAAYGVGGKALHSA